MILDLTFVTDRSSLCANIQVIILSLFIAVILKKPDEQVMNSVHDKDVDEAEKKFFDLCNNDIGKLLLRSWL